MIFGHTLGMTVSPWRQEQAETANSRASKRMDGFLRGQTADRGQRSEVERRSTEIKHGNELLVISLQRQVMVVSRSIPKTAHRNLWNLRANLR